MRSCVRLLPSFTPREVLPEARDDKNILRFKKWGHLFRAPMRIYGDLECALVNCYEPGTEGSMVYHKHKPVACSLRVVSDIPNFVISHFNYRGPDAHLRLVKRLKALAQQIEGFPNYPARCKKEDQRKFDEATSCFACGGAFVPGDKNLRKVFDHCHWTGKYRSAMHSACNLQCKREKKFSVFFHNLSKLMVTSLSGR